MGVIAQGGWGKTGFAGTAPNALFITTDPEGAQSAYQLGSTAREVKVHDQKALIDIQLDLLEGLAEKYDWLIVDDMTMVQYIFARTSMDARVRRSAAKAQKTAAQEKLDVQMASIVALVEGDGNLNRYVPEQNDRYTYQNATIDFAKWLTQLPMHVIMIYKRALSEYDYSGASADGSSDAYWTAAIEGRRGAVAEMCLGVTNIIGSGEFFTKKDGTEVRRMWFTHHEKHRGKDRTGRLGAFRDDLDIPRMMRLINAPPVETDGKEVASAGPARPRPRKKSEL